MWSWNAGLGLYAVLCLGGAPGRADEHAPVSKTLDQTETKSAASLTLDIEVVTRHDEGRVFCALWSEAEHFPGTMKHARAEGATDRIVQGQAHIQLKDLSAGEYALACFHDENANNELDTNFLGIPSEATGASNEARGRMGPPRYEDARFTLSTTGPKRLRVEVLD